MTSDDLPWPRDFERRAGEGHARALVLGGGGIFFVAWQVAYIGALKHVGVDLTRASMVVGTSAGSVVGALVTGDRLSLAERQLSVLSRLPAVVGAMAPASALNGSRQRALESFSQATDDHPDTIRKIGFAALAATSPPARALRRNIGALLAMRSWPSPALHIVTVDTYTGERLVVRRNSGVPVAAAAAASSSVPGIFSPQPILDRKCMDGGVSGSGLNCDVASGAERVIVLALGAEHPAPQPMFTIPTDSAVRERAALESAGSRVFIRGPLENNLNVLMSPTSVPAAMAMGREQAQKDAERLAQFWN